MLPLCSKPSDGFFSSESRINSLRWPPRIYAVIPPFPKVSPPPPTLPAFLHCHSATQPSCWFSHVSVRLSLRAFLWGGFLLPGMLLPGKSSWLTPSHPPPIGLCSEVTSQSPILTPSPKIAPSLSLPFATAPDPCTCSIFPTASIAFGHTMYFLCYVYCVLTISSWCNLHRSALWSSSTTLDTVFVEWITVSDWQALEY